MDAWPLSFSIPVFVAATGVIVFAGTLLSRTADRIADETGWGEALMGALFLAAVTSLPDLVATLTAVLDDRPELGMSNVMGSMAANLAFLAVADLTYRKANLEHAAASSSNLMLTGFMITLLVIPLLAMTTREVTLWGVHPGSLVLLLAYPFGFHLIRRAQVSPMWIPRWTRSTIEDRPVSSRSTSRPLPALWIQFGSLALLVSVAGYFLMSAGESIATRTELSDTAVGGLLTALSTSTPELVLRCSQ